MAGRTSGKSRSKYACRQCKIKRLKCDEATPACTSCLQRGWQCPGYGKHIRWSTKHERFGKLSPAPKGVHNGESVQQVTQQPFCHQLPSTSTNYISIPCDPVSTSHGHNHGDGHFESPPSHLSTDLAGQYIADDATVMHDEISPPSSHMPTSTPMCQIATPYQDYALGAQGVIATRPSYYESHALTSHSHDAFYAGARYHTIDPQMFYTPTHIPTILIEHWFSDVCPMWNIFDSHSNFNRQFASMSWSTSQPVFYAMQSMSAACLVDTLPALMPVFKLLTQKALAAIKDRICFYQNLKDIAMPEFPTDLMFSIFAMGTSLHWKHGFELGVSLLQHAHIVINTYKRNMPAMVPMERKHLAFFQKALMCWEGILSAADSGFTPPSFVARRQSYKARIAASQDHMTVMQPSFGPVTIPPSDAELHPWCGVSSDVCQKFGQVMTLCHLAQRRRRGTAETGEVEMRCDLGLAHELASELAAMNFSSTSQRDFMGDQHPTTNDNDTPLSHLLGIAEAYRLACLLQLCLTFDDLPIPPAAHSELGLSNLAQVDNTAIHSLNRSQELVAVSLQLVERLKNIPPESGSRCMQPLLYLCAASGLRLQLNPSHAQTLDQSFVPISNTEHSTDFGIAHPNLSPSPSHDSMTAASGPASNLTMTVSTLKVAQARSLVKKRLGMLQQLLPPRYTGTALRLAEAIWAEYDSTSDGGRPLYWSDVMMREKLQTFFG